MLFHPAQSRQWLAQFTVEACGNMLEPKRIQLQAVHQDDANAGESVIVQLADGLSHQIAPAEPLLIQRCAGTFPRGLDRSHRRGSIGVEPSASKLHSSETETGEPPQFQPSRRWLARTMRSASLSTSRKFFRTAPICSRAT